MPRPRLAAWYRCNDGEYAAAPVDPRNDPAVEAAYEAASDDLVAEILDGELHTLPRPRPRHARAATRLGGMLRGFDGEPSGDDPGGWILLHEPELHLGTGPDKVVPDLAGWRREVETFEGAAIAHAPPFDRVGLVLDSLWRW
ncbi:MAG: hypothetical protein U0414_12115 [Polyangiaceae bacterium]